MLFCQQKCFGTGYDGREIIYFKQINFKFYQYEAH
jgi:hypothetical protein